MFPGDDELQPLIEGMGQGEATALADFVEIVGPHVYGIHLRATGQTVAAAVLTERTFAELWRTAPLYDRQFGTPSDWILAVARGMSVDHLARRRGKESKLKSRPDAAAILAAVDAGPARPAAAAALDGLDAEDRAFLVDAWRAGLPVTADPVAAEARFGELLRGLVRSLRGAG